MNRTIKDATVKRYHCDSHDQLERHLDDFVSAYNFGRRLKILKGLMPYEFICKRRTSEPERFNLDPNHQMPALNNYLNLLANPTPASARMRPALRDTRHRAFKILSRADRARGDRLHARCRELGGLRRDGRAADCHRLQVVYACAPRRDPASPGLRVCRARSLRRCDTFRRNAGVRQGGHHRKRVTPQARLAHVDLRAFRVGRWSKASLDEIRTAF